MVRVAPLTTHGLLCKPRTALTVTKGAAPPVLDVSRMSSTRDPCPSGVIRYQPHLPHRRRIQATGWVEKWFADGQVLLQMLYKRHH